MEPTSPIGGAAPHLAAGSRVENRTARLLAGILGPTMIATTTTEWLNLHIWAEPSPTLTYLNGMVLFIGGITALRLHHSWRRSWTTTVTAAGWLLLAADLLRMAFPDAPQPRDGDAAEGVIAAVLGLGCLLIWLGYRPEDRIEGS
jgi:hypothetical protein